MDSIFDGLKGTMGRLGKELSEAFIKNFDTTEISNIIVDVDSGAREVIKTFGQGKEFVNDIKKSLTDAAEGVTRLGGNFNDVVRIQKDFSDALGRNVIMIGDSYDKLFAATQITKKDADDIINSFKNAGISAYDSSRQIENVVNTARKIGVNAELVTSKVLSNLDVLNKYNFKSGVEGLAKMAAQATNLRIDMRETLDFAEKVYSPEGAIETAAALQRLGVVQSDLLDPLRLMDLSQNDPAELQNQLVEMSKQFVKLNKEGRFEIMPGEQRRLREISKELGITYGELTKMSIGAAELDDKMKKINFPTDIDEDTQKLIANMSEMKDGEYKISLDGKDMGIDEVVNLAKTDKEKFDELIKSAQPKTLEQLQSEQLSVLESMKKNIEAMAQKTGMGLAASKPIEDFLKVVQTSSNTISKFVTDSFGSNQKIRENTDKLYIEVMGGLKGLISGEMSFETMGNKIGKVAEIMDKQFKENFLTATNNAANSLEKLKENGNNLVEVIESIIGQIPSGVTTKNVNDFIKLPGQVIQPLPQDTLFGGTGFEEMIDKITSVTNIQKKDINKLDSTNVDQILNNFDINNIISRMNNLVETKKNINENKITENINKNTTADINVNFKIDAPSQIDTNQLMLMLNTNDFKQTIIKTVADAFSPDDTSPSKKMNSFART